MPKRLLGRCVAIDGLSITIRNQTGLETIKLSSSPSVALGDILEIENGRVRVLTPNRSGKADCTWIQRTLDPRRLNGTRMRTQIESLIREFFVLHGFLETRTPLLVPCPGMEPHIRPFSVSGVHGNYYLPTSPEFAMKRLLTGGLERIFQICPAFRDEPVSTTHQPEFTMLEWYRAYAGYEDIMRDTELLFEFIAKRLFGRPVLKFGEQEISVATPWLRLRVRDLFWDIAGVDLVKASRTEDLAKECTRLGLACDLARENWDDLYFKIWLNVIEPKLPADRAVFVTRYPASQAALAVVDRDPDGSAWARRFEVYAGGLELGNAFEELTDPIEQRKRFEKDMKLRQEVYGPDFPPNPLDEGFLGALTEGMPPAGGIAVGVDRMVMLFANEPDIRFTQWMGAGSSPES